MLLAAAFLAICIGVSAAADTGIPELIEKAEPSVVRIDVELAQGSSIGSGFLTEGRIVTNWHVVRGAVAVSVTFADKSSHVSEGLLAVDIDRDVAVLSVPTLHGRTGLRIARQLPRKGQTVVAFGAPRGFSFTTSDGIVSGVRTSEEIKVQLGKEVSEEDITWVQTNAPISEGNSGGPLIGLDGSVYGINTWYYKKGQNLNFASACTELSKVIAVAKSANVKPFSEAPEESNIASSDSEAQVQRLLYVLFMDELEERLSKAVTYHANCVERYERRYKDPRTTAESLANEAAMVERAFQNVSSLRSWTPAVGQFLKGNGTLVGRPGSWYILQVLDDHRALVKPSRSSDELMMVRGLNAVGLVDGITRTFDGVWFTVAETYSYSTVGGSTRTVYVVESSDAELPEILDDYRAVHVRPAVEKALSALKEPVLSSGAEASKINAERSRLEAERKAQRKKESQLASLKANQRIEAAAEEAAWPDLRNAERFAERRPQVANRYYRRVLEEHPNSGAAIVARERLGYAAKDHFRLWQSGERFKRLAYVRSDNESLTMKLPNGALAKLPLSRLSPVDQEYVGRIASYLNPSPNQ